MRICRWARFACGRVAAAADITVWNPSSSIWATQAFARLRLGIGRKDGAREITDYVLDRFDAAEAALMEKVLDRAADQAECWLDDGIEKAMNRFNGVVDSERKS